MIRLRTEQTNAAAIMEPLFGGAEQVEQILVGEIEHHPREPEPYCRYLHIVTQEGELVMELWADNPDALALRNLG